MESLYSVIFEGNWDPYKVWRIVTETNIGCISS